MLAYTLANGDYPVLESNIEHAGDAGAAVDTEQLARIAALRSKIEIIGVVGRNCFAPRLTVTLRDDRRLTKEYDGRELMWDFAKDAGLLRRFIPGLPITSERYDRLVETIANLDAAESVDDTVRLTLPEA